MSQNNVNDEKALNERQPDDRQASALKGDNTIKDPDDWTTGDEPMTGAQRSYLKTLSDEAGEEVNDNLSKAEASKRINELQDKTGRGTSQNTEGSS